MKIVGCYFYVLDIAKPLGWSYAKDEYDDQKYPQSQLILKGLVDII